MVELIVRLQQATLPVLSACMAVFGLAWIVLLIIRLLSAAMKYPWRLFRSQPVVGQIVCGVLVLAWVSFAAMKRGESTNSPPLGLLSVMCPTIEEVLPHEVSPAEIARGYYLVEEEASLPLADLPDGCETNDLLRLRGGFDWVFDIAPTNWYFPYRDGYLTNVTVFTRGEVRPSMRQTFFPVPLTNGVSLLPEGRWSLLTNGPSIFRHCVTTNGTLLLDWRNALVGRDLACPTNLQFALAQDGSFAVRTTGHAEVYAPVFPFDWDNDGLANEVDPSPTCADPDAHGANAAWYNTVCSNVFAAVDGPDGVILSPRHGGVNTNAYYFVDVVAEKGPAAISFRSDRESRLGSPVIIARAGETNHVPLLIGIEYFVTSTVPMSVSVPASGSIHIATNNSNSLTVQWPLNFAFNEDCDNTNRSYSVAVEPYNPGGTFTWNEHGSTGAVLQNVTPPTTCGCVTCFSNRIVVGCSPACACDGGCAATGFYSFEYAIFAITGGVCRCGFEDPVAGPPPQYVPTDSASLTISFSTNCVLFEDFVSDMSLETGLSRSSRVLLTISAYGGQNGGELTLSSVNLSKLISVSGRMITLPDSIHLSAEGVFHTNIVLQAQEASFGLDDVVVSGSLRYSESETSITDSDSLTVVELQFCPEMLIGENRCRHRIGVCERSQIKCVPRNVDMVMSKDGSGSLAQIGGSWYYTAPLTNEFFRLSAYVNGVIYPFQLTLVEPERVRVNATEAFDYCVPENVAGGAGMELELIVMPTNVSFLGISVQEVPSTQRDADGLCLHEWFSFAWLHSSENGAGRWHQIQIGNRFMYDRAEMGDRLPLFRIGEDLAGVPVWGWSIGHIRWPIPVGWNVNGCDDDQTPVKRFQPYDQVFSLDAEGTLSVRKLGYEVERGTNNVIRLNGDVVPPRQLRMREDN